MMDYTATVQMLNNHEDHYLGMHKFKEDVLRYTEIIQATKPEFIIETGSDTGDSALWFSQFAPVVSVDIGHEFSHTEGKITWIAGDSTSSSVFSQVKKMAQGKRVLVSLDSDHSYAHVAAEMVLYSTLVKSGDYMVVEDGIIKQWWGIPGPLEAITEFLQDNPQWSLDTQIDDRYPIGTSPGGWLKKKGAKK